MGHSSNVLWNSDKMFKNIAARNEYNELHELWIFQPIVGNETNKKKSENFFNLLIARNVKWCRNGLFLLFFFFFAKWTYKLKYYGKERFFFNETRKWNKRKIFIFKTNRRRRRCVVYNIVMWLLNFVKKKCALTLW